MVLQIGLSLRRGTNIKESYANTIKHLKDIISCHCVNLSLYHDLPRASLTQRTHTDMLDIGVDYPALLAITFLSVN